ncbi:MAG TPA: DinB family protein [Candidatus Acidoferrales bacterium]|nr:DinB family protein [Candidatus Acidoferrales bacterium]
MRKTIGSFLVVVLFGVLAGASAASAQQTAKKAPGPEQVLLRQWNAVGSQVIAMAEDWPADKYDYRPNDKVRTFGQILAHLASSNYYATNAALGKSTKGIENDPKEYTTKEQIVAFVKKSFADGAVALEKGGNAGAMAHLGDWVGIIEHSGEHFGNLVTYYRNNNVVPPESRPKK